MKCILYKKALPLILLSCLLLGACGNSKNDDVSKEPLSHTSTEKAPGTLHQRCSLQPPTAHKPIPVMWLLSTHQTAAAAIS